MLKPQGVWLLWPYPLSINRKIVWHIACSYMYITWCKLAAVSIVWNLEVVCYSGAAIALHISWYI